MGKSRPLPRALSMGYLWYLLSLHLFLKMVQQAHGLSNSNVTFVTGVSETLKGLNKKYYLQGTGGHEFKRTYLALFPVWKITTGASADSHYDIEVTLNDSSSISYRSGKTVRIGNEVNKNWLANYILGDDDGALASFFKWTLGFARLDEDELEFARDWLRNQTADNSIEIKDALW